MENTRIPFMGDIDVGESTLPEELIWLDPWDRVPILLALSLYRTPRVELAGYLLIAKTIRIGVWYDYQTESVIVGLRGTKAHYDVADDYLIVTGDYCDLSLVKETIQLLKTLPPRNYYYIFAGHSLGGTAAMCLVSQFLPNARGISVNGGASPSNPILDGPGPAHFTHYHVLGDLISSHMGPGAAKIIRVKVEGVGFGSLVPHGSGNLLKATRPASVEEEDAAYLEWTRTTPGLYHIVSPMLAVTRFLTYLQVRRYGIKSPIPGSIRALERKNV